MKTEAIRTATEVTGRDEVIQNIFTSLRNSLLEIRKTNPEIKYSIDLSKTTESVYLKIIYEDKSQTLRFSDHEGKSAIWYDWTAPDSCGDKVNSFIQEQVTGFLKDVKKTTSRKKKVSGVKGRPYRVSIEEVIDEYFE